MSVQSENSKTFLFEKEKISRAVMKLAVPTVCSSLVMVLYNLADTYFVGMLKNPIQNVAVTLAYPVLLAFNAVNNLFGVGASSMMSRALGRKDYRCVSQSSAVGFYCALFSAALFSLLCFLFQDSLLQLLGADALSMEATKEYLFWTVICGAVPAILNVVLAYLVRSEGESLHASIGTMSGCFLNIVLDPIFILPFGLNMGAAGAGLATFLSNCVACLYFFVLLYVKRKKTFVCINPKMFTWKKDIILGIGVVGIPASIQNLLNVTGTTILNNFTVPFGASAVAAMGIAQKINMIPLQVALGFSQGMMPLVGYTYAGRMYHRMKHAISYALRLLVPVLIGVSTLYFICSEQLIQMFMDNEEVIRHGSWLLRGMCIGLPFMCIDFLAVGVFQALGNGKYALIFATMRKIILEIPALFILNLIFPLYGLAYAQPFAEVVLAIVSIIMLNNIFRKTGVLVKENV